MILENPRFQLIPAAPELAEEIRSQTSLYGRCPWIPEPESEPETIPAAEPEARPAAEPVAKPTAESGETDSLAI